ncbi:MAG: Hsp70 family protein [Myxococcaceae bacterium]
MPRPALGIDFGTSNTAAAVWADGKPRVLALDPKAIDARLFRSVLFFPDEGHVISGAEAIAAYLEQADGRFLQSLKTFLPIQSFVSTAIKHRPFTLEALLALIIHAVKASVERELGEKVDRLVLGRPARFSEDPQVDAFAERRLRRAAEEAGFKDIHFRIEPLAAGLSHESTLDHDELVLTADFGAGTSDFTVVRLSPARHRQPDRSKDVLASAGVYVGGDRIDGAIMEKKLLQYFGAHAIQRPMGLGAGVGMPSHLLRKLLSWHTMSFIRDRSTQQFLEDFLRTTDDPAGIGAFIDLVNHNLGYHLFRAIEAAKVELSTRQKTHLSFHDARVNIEVDLTRREFEAMIAPLVEQLVGAIDTVLSKAGIAAKDIDTVVLTGGTSLIPAIGKIFESRFAPEKLHRADAFSSVAEGLAVAAMSLDA